MRRLLRILFNLATIVSLLFSLAAAAMWIRSRWFHEGVTMTALRDDDTEIQFTRINRWALWSCRRGLLLQRATELVPSFYLASLSPEESSRLRAATGEWQFYWAYRRTHSPLVHSQWNVLGFEYLEGLQDVDVVDLKYGAIVVPFWFLVVGGGLWPVANLALRRLKRWRRDQGIRTGLCHVCNYDLRATPNRCPECGAIPP